MAELLEQSEAQVIFWLAVLAIACAVGYYAVDRARRLFYDQSTGSSELIGDFRSLHSKGELSDEEYNEIKAKLAKRLVDELKDNEDEGCGRPAAPPGGV